MKKLNILLFLFCMVTLTSCKAFYVSYSGLTPMPPITEDVVILQLNEAPPQDVITVGILDLRGGLLFEKSTYDKAMIYLTNLAKEKGANIVKINSQQEPGDFLSTHGFGAILYSTKKDK